MSNLEEHEAEQARITAEWEERNAPYIPEDPGQDAKHFYVTVTWDNWPEGGSFGAVVLADDHDHAEKIAFWQMAQSRASGDYDEASILEGYSDQWHIVDCYVLAKQIEIWRRENPGAFAAPDAAPGNRYVYVVAGSYDYNDFADAFTTRQQAIARVAEAFDYAEWDDKPDLDTPAFWSRCMETYGEGKWKSFQLYRLDTHTMAMEIASHSLAEEAHA